LLIVPLLSISHSSVFAVYVGSTSYEKNCYFRVIDVTTAVKQLA